MSDHGHDPQVTGGKQGFEPTDLVPRQIVIVAVILTVSMALVGGLCIMIIIALRNMEPIVEDERVLAVTPDEQVWTATVRLQDDPGMYQQHVNREDQRMAQDYGVLSDEPPIYRIPIDAALDIIARDGFPEFTMYQPASGAAGAMPGSESGSDQTVTQEEAPSSAELADTP